jgi:DNA-binding beta-propeller fold protein YncE
VRSFATRFGRDLGAFAASNAGFMYLSSSSKNAIITIDPDGQQGLLAGDRTALHHPSGLAVGLDGSLFVANKSGRNILIFAPGSKGNVSPAGEISGPATSLVAPQAVATDAAGNVYVFDGPTFTQGPEADHFVRVFAAGVRGNTAPTTSYPVKTKCWANAP